MPEDMSTKDDQKAMGRLEKGVEVLEKGVAGLEKSHGEHTLQVINLLNDIRGDFKRDIDNIHLKIDDRINNLGEKFDTAIKGQNEIKLSVQKVATTVSVIVGVGVVILKGVFEVAKDALASTFFHQ